MAGADGNKHSDAVIKYIKVQVCYIMFTSNIIKIENIRIAINTLIVIIDMFL